MFTYKSRDCNLCRLHRFVRYQIFMHRSIRLGFSDLYKTNKQTNNNKQTSKQKRYQVENMNQKKQIYHSSRGTTLLGLRPLCYTTRKPGLSFSLPYSSLCYQLMEEFRLMLTVARAACFLPFANGFYTVLGMVPRPERTRTPKIRRLAENQTATIIADLNF